MAVGGWCAILTQVRVGCSESRHKTGRGDVAMDRFLHASGVPKVQVASDKGGVF